MGESIDLDKPAGLKKKTVEEKEAVHSLFREKQKPPPKIGWAHAWGMTKWGKRAGPWGQGIDGLDQRKDRR